MSIFSNASKSHLNRIFYLLDSFVLNIFFILLSLRLEPSICFRLSGGERFSESLLDNSYLIYSDCWFFIFFFLRFWLSFQSLISSSSSAFLSLTAGFHFFAPPLALKPHLEDFEF